MISHLRGTPDPTPTRDNQSMATTHERHERRLTGRPWLTESRGLPRAAIAVLTVATAAEALTRALLAPAGGSALTPIVVTVLALGTTLPLAFLPAVPAAVAVSAVGVLSLGVFRSLTVAGLAAQVVALYRLGRDGPETRLRFLAALAVPYAALALLATPRTEESVLAVLLAALAPAAALAGMAGRARADAATHHAARESVARSLVEHTARGERARIARELHDVVAHHISMIAVQAETARFATPGLPPAGAARLLEIGDTARAGLTEMRRLLGVLREDADTAAPERHPQPGLPELAALIDEARRASGTATRLIVSGRPTALDPGVELAVYRIAQEGLTNARRHAPGAAVDVELCFGPDALLLRIRDNGPGPSPHAGDTDADAGRQSTDSSGRDRSGLRGGGHGLMGMKERAVAAGGELRTGPAWGGGFLIEAALPVRTRTATVDGVRGLGPGPETDARDAAVDSTRGQGLGGQADARDAAVGSVRGLGRGAQADAQDAAVDSVRRLGRGAQADLAATPVDSTRGHGRSAGAAGPADAAGAGAADPAGAAGAGGPDPHPAGQPVTEAVAG